MTFFAKLQNMIKRAVVQTPRSDHPQSNKYLTTQASSFESPPTNVEIFTPYGLYSNPPSGALGFTFNIGADHTNMFGMFNITSLRFATVPGEVAIGNPLSKAVIYFRNNGDVDITIPGVLTATITKDVNITISGNANVTVDGSATIQSQESVSIIAPSITLSGELTEALSADALTKFNELKEWADNHIHTGGTEPGDFTGMPTDPLPTTSATQTVQAS